MALGYSKQSTLCVIAAAALFAAISLALSPASASYVPVYGGPTYDASTQSGYQSPGLPVSPGRTAGDGVAVGYAEKYTGGTDRGPRAVRWDASGSTATELGNLGTSSSGFTNIDAYAINTAGATVGSAYKYTGGTLLGQRAVRWNASGTAATELGNIGTNSSGQTSSEAFAVDAAGTAVGFATKYLGDLNFGSRAVRWDASSTAATELGGLGTCNNCTSVALAVNSAGTAVGQAEKYSGNTYFGTLAVRWDASGTAATELATIGNYGGGNTYNVPNAVNTAGTVVGYANKFTGNVYQGRRAVRWDGSGIAATELGNLGTISSGYTNSTSYAVNDAGTAVGYATKYDAFGNSLGDRAVRWDASDSAAIELGNLGTIGSGLAYSYAYAINTAGFAVGYAGTLRTVLWDLDGVAFDLNAMIDPNSGWTLNYARDISDTNWVTGIGWFDPDGAGPLAGYDRAFLLDASSLLPAPGDFNHDGTVNAADYVVWRKTGGSQSDYNDWRSHFGLPAGSGAALPSAEPLSAAVPEPSTLAMLLFGVLLLGYRRRARAS